MVAAVLHPLLAGRIVFERDILTYWYEEVGLAAAVFWRQPGP